MFKKIISCMAGVFMLTGCGDTGLSIYKDTLPKADIKEYFTGHIKAWGIVQDWRGRVVNRFDVNMVGTWSGDTGTLQEEFTYYDGKKQHRTWIITKRPDGTYTGTAGDIIGDATGAESGSAINWHYTMDVPVDDTTYRLKFDDWMWQMNDGVLINRSYMKKFGFTVAELTLFMQKQDK